MTEEEKKIIIEIEDEKKADTKTDKKTVRVLSFMLGGENYCIDMKQARETVRLGQYTKVPNAPEFIIGVMNLRGAIISVLDIRYFFGLQRKERTDEERVIISDAAGFSVGILIESIKTILDIEEESIQPPLTTLDSRIRQYTKGQIQIGNEILIYLDLEKILKTDEIERLRKRGE